MISHDLPYSQSLQFMTLEDVDCNCNNCKHLERDLVKFNAWKDKHISWQLWSFENWKERTNKQIDEHYQKQEFNAGFELEQVLAKAKFLFDGSPAKLSYGKCNKFQKEVSFLPGAFQLDTQECFENRRNGK